MIVIKEISKEFSQGKHRIRALNNVTLSLHNEMTAIIGTSGAGKSTLLNILAGVEPLDKGEIYIDNFAIHNSAENDLAKFRNANIGIVMQNYSLISDFSVLENVYLPLSFSRQKHSKKDKRDKALEALKLVGIEYLADRDVNELSGGQMQRVAIARAVINSPRYILADEPTGALDGENTEKIIDLFKEINAKGVGIILVTHDMGVAHCCQRIVQLEDGKVVDDYTL
ncbi:MAG: ABC transporter ATP-binding protein [Clostridia bacterium]|nr:ABC transporter ATP-binding protein [Clostridia bacterium]